MPALVNLPTKAVGITPSDTAANNFVGVYVGGTGDLVVQGIDGVSVTFKACPVGFILPMQVTKVLSTNTTATSLVGFLG